MQTAKVKCVEKVDMDKTRRDILMLKKALMASLIMTSIFLTIFSALSPSLKFEAAAETSFPTLFPLLYIEPENITGNVNDEFTISLKIFNLTNKVYWDPLDPRISNPLGNLYGLDINFSWDPFVLEYVSHTLTLPVEQYPNGVLHEPILGIKNTTETLVNGTYRITFASMSPAAPFNNANASSTIFNMTFRVRAQGATDLALLPVARANTRERPAKLSSESGDLIIYAYRGASFVTVGAPEAHFTVVPPDRYAVANETMTFNASDSQPSGAIDLYMWDFGDGSFLNTTEIIVLHSYARTGVYYPRLRVQSMGVSSAWWTGAAVTVVAKRDLSVLFFRFSASTVLWNDTLTINVTSLNKGEARESFTVSAYYNTTATGGWVLIGEKQVEALDHGTSVVTSFDWNTSSVPGEDSAYYFLANLTLIPYDANATDNQQTSNDTKSAAMPIWFVHLVTEPYHDIQVGGLEYRSLALGNEFLPPPLVGESVAVRFRVRAEGTYQETFNLTVSIVYAPPNNTFFAGTTYVNEFLEKYTDAQYEYIINATDAGDFMVSVDAEIAELDKYPEDNNVSQAITVVSPPQLVIDRSPSTIHVSENATFDARASYQENGSIITYVWHYKAAGEGDVLYRGEMRGSVVNYSFASNGNWFVRLRVVDSWGITYDASRPATSQYLLITQFFVEQAAGGVIPLEMVAAIIVAIVVVGVIVYVLYKRAQAKREREAEA